MNGLKRSGGLRYEVAHPGVRRQRFDLCAGRSGGGASYAFTHRTASTGGLGGIFILDIALLYQGDVEMWTITSRPRQVGSDVGDSRPGTGKTALGGPIGVKSYADS